MIVRRLTAIGLSFSLAAAALALLFQIVRAAPAGQNRFVATNGSSILCSQILPCQLPIALILANAGDTIYVQQGTYTGSGAAVITVTQSITLYGGWNGNPSGPIVRNPAAYPTLIDAQGRRRGMFVSAGITPTIDGFVIKNGNATGLINGCSQSSAGGCGGGVFVDHAAAQILHNQFISNTALITDTNIVYGAGGGLFLESANGAVISANVFLSNSASLPYTLTMGTGGGLAVMGYHPDSLIVQNNTFQANTGFWGGGLSLNAVNFAQVQGNLLLNNKARGEGAGLYGWSSAAGPISGNTFRGNAGDAPAFLGFFVGSFSANLLVDNSTSYGLIVGANNTPGAVFVYNNIIAHNGGVGILADANSSNPLTIFVLNNTLVGSGFGTGLLLSTGYVTMTAHNTLISGFGVGASINVPLSSTLNMYYTLFDTDVVSHGNATLSHTVQGTAGFIDPANRNYHIGFNSAARDNGGLTIVPTDFDGDPRPLGAANDIGADETRFLHGLFLPLTRR